MKQDLHLGEMLKARLAEKQQPIQLNLFDDGDYVVHEVKHAMNLSLDAVYKLRDNCVIATPMLFTALNK
jgi:hypothetical protein